MRDPLRLVVIGCGGIANAYLDALQRSNAFRIVACADIDIERARIAAARSGAEPIADALQWLRAGGNVVLSVVLCLAAVTLGYLLASSVLRAG